MYKKEKASNNCDIQMGRSPYCDSSGLKKGPWTPEEDHKLLAYIQQHGHGSWRALPPKAGTLLLSFWQIQYRNVNTEFTIYYIFSLRKMLVFFFRCLNKKKKKKVLKDVERVVDYGGRIISDPISKEESLVRRKSRQSFNFMPSLETGLCV